MASKKDLIIAVLITFCLTATLFTIIPIRSEQGSSYDAWKDLNDDGVIDSTDLGMLGTSWATTGDPTKNVNVTNWPIDEQGYLKTVIKPKILKGAERIVLLENFLGKIRFDANSWPEVYFTFIPKGELINITGVYCNIIYSSTGSWGGSEKFVDIGINYQWSRHYYFWSISPTGENRIMKYDITDISSQIKIGINRAWVCSNIYSDEGTVYLNYWELIIEYYYMS
jgi:hypothetical protein